jgi:hypothetical protein
VYLELKRCGRYETARWVESSSIRSVALASQDGWELRSVCRFCKAVGALGTESGAISCTHSFVLLELTLQTFLTKLVLEIVSSILTRMLCDKGISTISRGDGSIRLSEYHLVL